MGQGGCQAIEDAVILAHQLSHATSLEDSLRAYESRRHPRTKKFVTHSALMTSVAHGHPLWARLARATVFRWMPEAIKLREMKSLYKFEL